MYIAGRTLTLFMRLCTCIGIHGYGLVYYPLVIFILLIHMPFHRSGCSRGCLFCLICRLPFYNKA